jgi:F-type H+-transporting ATPase subunit delta
MMKIRTVRRQAKKLFRLCVVNGLLDQARVRQVMALVLEGRRRNYLALLSQFQRLVKLHYDEHTAEVQGSEPLSADLQDRIAGWLKGMYGTELAIQFSQSPELIAGMRVRVASDVYDGSVQHQLAVLEKRFRNHEGQ